MPLITNSEFNVEKIPKHFNHITLTELFNPKRQTIIF